MVRDVPSLIIPCPCLHGKGQEFAVKDSNLSKKYTQINGEIALCQKKNQQFNWHGDFVFEYRDGVYCEYGFHW